MEKNEVTKKVKLAIVVGFKTDIKNGREVPKDSKFSPLAECCEIDTVS